MPVTSTSGQGRQLGSKNRQTGDIRKLARTYGQAAIRALAELALLEEPENEMPPPSEWARIAALKELLDRGFGKASQVLASDPDNPLQFVIRAPAAVASTQEWLQRYAPKQIESAAVDTESLQEKPPEPAE